MSIQDPTLTSPSPFAPDVRLGPFLVGAELGRGGVGVVRAGRHEERGVDVAIKFVPALVSSPKARGRFRREVESMARLDHPNVVLVFDYGEVPGARWAQALCVPPGSPYLVTELCSGGSLATRPRPSDWPALRDILLSLLDGLAHAHARGLLHRDVKPANSLYALPTDLRPGYKLADFGLARALEEPTEGDAQTVRGTPRYMAPEQFRLAWREQGPWTDLYALGCAAHELTTGRAPFVAGSTAELARLHLEAPPPALSCDLPVPSEFQAWMGRLLHKDPRGRFECAADAARALLELRDPEPPLYAESRSKPAAHSAAGTLTDSTLTALTAVALDVGWAVGARLPAAAPRPQTHGRAPVPGDWRGPDDGERALREVERARRFEISGTGLSLFGLRPVPFVGRARERDQLWAELRAVAEQGRARAIWLTGPTGHGTSRLAEWLTERAQELGCATVWKVDGELDSAPHGALAAAVRRRWRCRGDRFDETVEIIERELRADGVATGYDWHALATLAHPRTDHPRRAQFGRDSERYAALRCQFQLESRRRVVIVWLDDADRTPDGLALVQHLLDSQAHEAQVHEACAVLCILTASREVPRDSALSSLPRIELRPLTTPEQGALIEGALALQPDLAARVALHTAGDPLYAIQLLDEWVRRGQLVTGANGFALASNHTLTLPPSRVQLWSDQVEALARRLPHATQRALELAAAAGVEVQHERWCRAAVRLGLQPDADIIDALARDGVVRWTVRWAADSADGASVWRFAHSRWREALASKAREAGQWAQFHGAWADQLSQEVSAGRIELQFRLGVHDVEAGNLARGVASLLDAATRAHDEGDFTTAEAAVHWAESALDSLDSRATADRIRWGVLRARMLLKRGKAKNSAVCCAQLEQWARLVDHPASWASVEHVLATVAHVLGRPDEALERYQRSADWAAQCGDFRAQSDAIRSLGDICRTQRRVDDAEQSYLRAHQLAERTDSLAARSSALRGLSWVARQLGNTTDAQRYAEDALESAQKAGNRYMEAACRNEVGEVARHAGRLDEAKAHYEEALRGMARLGAAEQWPMRLNLALLLLDQDHYSEARALLESSLTPLRSTGRTALLAAAHALLLPCMAAAGDASGWTLHSAHAEKLLRESRLVDKDVARALRRAAELALLRGWTEQAEQARQWSSAQEPFLDST